MGVVPGVGSMSATTDVIYTHKKFKKAAVEAWESKDIKTNLTNKNESINIGTTIPTQYSECKSSSTVPTNKCFNSSNDVPLLSLKDNEKQYICTTCGFLNSNETIFNRHNCCINGEKELFCNVCKNKFKNSNSFTNHDCISPHINKDNGIIQRFCVNSSGDFRLDKQNDDRHTFIYNRSQSCPYSSETNDLDNEIKSKNAPPVQRLKQIYKPKFRAHYSFNEDQAGVYNQLSEPNKSRINNNAQESVFSIASSIPTTYHISTATTSSDSDSGSSSISHVSSFEKSKPEDSFSIQKLVTSQYSGLWKGIKGIKSPSPELVNQHITNLIVQNQAIVETHNPLWSIKYRRQSSSGSISENENHSKCSKFNENIKNNRNKSFSSREKVVTQHSDALTSSALSLPKSTFSPTNSRASKLSISTDLSSSPSRIKAINFCNPDTLYLNQNILNCKEGNLQLQPNTLQFSKVSSDKIAGGIITSSKEIKKLQNHTNISLLQIHSPKYDKNNKQFQDHSNGSYIDQVAALDLHKKDPQFLQDLRQQSNINTNYNEEVNLRIITPTSLENNAIFLSSPPTKRRKLSINEFSHKTQRIETHGMTMLDDLHKPRTNSNHIFGGEVKICDGRQYKTLKIDSIKNETPSLDMCIASKHLSAVSEQNETSIPTSVVVTIAKCGLNSGGTMVKIGNKKRELESPISSSDKFGNISDKIMYSSNVGTESSKIICSRSLNDVSDFPVISSSFIPSGLSVHLVKESNSPSTLGMNAGSSSTFVSSSNSPVKKDVSANSYSNIITYPTVYSLGNDQVPCVPGIPGPYSQANLVVKYASNETETNRIVLPTSISTSNSLPIRVNHIQCLGKSVSPLLYSTGIQLNNDNQSSEIRGQMIKVAASLKGNETSLVNTYKYQSANNSVESVGKISESSIPLSPNKTETNVDTGDNKLKFNKPKQDGDTNTFLVPRQRPNTLLIKPQTICSKSSLALIGSTLVSPDTPRPKKSCAQLFLNGSAYTYLNLKVSTKTFFCCIYRPQPMYVCQSRNPKLSMYSNWQIRLTEDPIGLNLSPPEAMNLHISGSYYNRSYTIAKVNVDTQLILTPSSYWIQKQKENEKEIMLNKIKRSKSNENLTDISTNLKSDAEFAKEIKLSISETVSEQEELKGNTKRIKIFEGGFKTNEDYIYVKGRGRGRYMCGTCGIRCKKPSMLKKHIRTHTDLRPFACKHCSFSFKTKGNLTKHLKSKVHFKRCTEMGINPVPTVVDDSHISKDALKLQEELAFKKDEMTEDDDDEEEADEDCDDECEDDEDEDENEDSLHRSSSSSLSGSENTASSDISSNSASKFDISNNSKFSTLDSNSFNMDNSSVKQSSVFDDSGAMDLSVKRISVISLPLSKQSSENRPNFLLLNKGIGDSTSSQDKNCHPTTPITEILSPVTESSHILKSIYDTTSSLDKRHFSSVDPMKGCSSSMLHTYLKERAVVDSVRKRQQCTQAPSKQSQDLQVVHLISLPTSSNLTLATSSSNTSDNKLSTVANSINSERIVILLDNCNTDTEKRCHDDPESKQKFDTFNQNIPFVPDQTSSVTTISSTKDVNSVVTSYVSLPSSPTYIMATKVSTTCSFSSTRPSSIITSRPSRTVSSLDSNNTTSSMPIPPANLTVVNSCEGDSKPAFLAPSGVMPSSSSRSGSDDGKCKCSICNKEFGKQSQLRLHMNIHFIERPHRCNACGVSFRTNGHLQKHKRSVSHFNKVNMNLTFGTPSTDNPRPFKCHDCKIAFRIHGHLAKHLRSKLHIMKLECLRKLPFGTYAEIERSGVNLNEIDTSDCENSLESLQAMAAKLYEKEPSKLLAWQNQKEEDTQHRMRTSSNISTNSEEYHSSDPDNAASRSNEEDSGDEDDVLPEDCEGGNGSPATENTNSPSSSSSSLPPCQTVSENTNSPPSSTSFSLPPCEIGCGATEGLVGCPKCYQKFLDVKNFEVHYYNKHEKDQKLQPKTDSCD